MSALDAVALYTGLNLLILLFIGVRVSLVRRRLKVSIGEGGSDEMLRAIRVHANGADWVPGALSGLRVLAMMDAPALSIHALGGLLTVARAAHAYGFTMTSGPSPARVLGASLTLLVYLLLGVGLVLHAIA